MRGRSTGGPWLVIVAAALGACGGGPETATTDGRTPVAATSLTVQDASGAPRGACGGRAAPIEKFVFNGRGARTDGTITCIPEGRITAAHVVRSTSREHFRPTGHDMVWLGGPRALAPRTPMSPGDRVVLVGYAAGSHRKVERRTGVVERAWKPGEWLVRYDDGQKPAQSGMSGGAVLDEVGQVRGILKTRNRKVDLDGDGDRENSSIVVDLAAWSESPG